VSSFFYKKTNIFFNGKILFHILLMRQNRRGFPAVFFLGVLFPVCRLSLPPKRRGELKEGELRRHRKRKGTAEWASRDGRPRAGPSRQGRGGDAEDEDGKAKPGGEGQGRPRPGDGATGAPRAGGDDAGRARGGRETDEGGTGRQGADEGGGAAGVGGTTGAPQTGGHGEDDSGRHSRAHSGICTGGTADRDDRTGGGEGGGHRTAESGGRTRKRARTAEPGMTITFIIGIHYFAFLFLPPEGGLFLAGLPDGNGDGAETADSRGDCRDGNGIAISIDSDFAFIADFFGPDSRKTAGLPSREKAGDNDDACKRQPGGAHNDF